MKWVNVLFSRPYRIYVLWIIHRFRLGIRDQRCNDEQSFLEFTHIRTSFLCAYIHMCFLRYNIGLWNMLMGYNKNRLAHQIHVERYCVCLILTNTEKEAEKRSQLMQLYLRMLDSVLFLNLTVVCPFLWFILNFKLFLCVKIVFINAKHYILTTIH